MRPRLRCHDLLALILVSLVFAHGLLMAGGAHAIAPTLGTAVWRHAPASDAAVAGQRGEVVADAFAREALAHPSSEVNCTVSWPAVPAQPSGAPGRDALAPLATPFDTVAAAGATSGEHLAPGLSPAVRRALLQVYRI